MIQAYQEQLLDALQAAGLNRSGFFSWFGKRAPRLPPALWRGLPVRAKRNWLRSTILSRLYSSFYATGGVVPARTEGASWPPLADASFVKEIAKANAGTGCWEPGWRIVTDAAGALSLVRGGVRVRMPSEELIRDEEESGGEKIVRLHLPRALPDLLPGYYVALGDAHLSHDTPGNLVRVYWHVTAAGAARLLHSLTLSLNGERIPFRFKIPTSPVNYTRCDAAVLYFARQDYEFVRPLLEAIHREVAPFLRRRTPALTKELAPGLALAEQPPSGNSFGMDRCGLLADSIIRAYELGRTSQERRLLVVLDHFRRAGIRLNTPYLNPGPMRDYGFGSSGHHIAVQLPVSDEGASRPAPSRLLQTAERIGRRLCEEAVWHEERCTWLGAQHPDREGSGRWIYGSLGVDFYSGTSGIALFLTELHGAVPDPEFKRIALGALRHSVTHADLVPADQRFGLYTGWTGIAYAGVYAGRLLGDEGLVACGARLASRVMAEAGQSGSFDLIAGRAGTILGPLALYDLIEDQSLLDSAVRLGQELIAGARRDKWGWSWASPEHPAQRGLLGYSHGTAGAATAFAELYRTTRIPVFEQAARGAFAYERYWFDNAQSNWPDFRYLSAGRVARTRDLLPGNPGAVSKRRCVRTTSAAVLPFSTTWCHGAPGIALSRLQAYRVFGEEEWKTEALVALNTTLRSVESALAKELPTDFCLCHGVCGNAEVLLQGHLVLGQGFSSGEALALRVARIGIERYVDGVASWPCAQGDSTTPALMLGLAGIGQFYLRLYDPGLPSALSFTRERPASKVDAV